MLAVSRALDRMRARVRRLIDDRTQMLAAISHDLRTPITRLRLRAEFIEDEHPAPATLRDLDQMNGLVEAALSFVRDGQTRDASSLSLVDLASVVQTVCDDFSDFGAPVRVGRSRHVLVQGRPEELQRAITNLVDNAVKYGGRAEVQMESSERGIRVCVLDQGPGIPETRDATPCCSPSCGATAPAISTRPSGFGLGLSIVLAIVEAHGGELALLDREPHGLIVRIRLPVRQARRAAA